jgi:hypothetical protein
MVMVSETGCGLISSSQAILCSELKCKLLLESATGLLGSGWICLVKFSEEYNKMSAELANSVYGDQLPKGCPRLVSPNSLANDQEIGKLANQVNFGK